MPKKVVRITGNGQRRKSKKNPNIESVRFKVPSRKKGVPSKWSPWRKIEGRTKYEREVQIEDYRRELEDEANNVRETYTLHGWIDNYSYQRESTGCVTAQTLARERLELDRIRYGLFPEDPYLDEITTAYIAEAFTRMGQLTNHDGKPLSDDQKFKTQKKLFQLLNKAVREDVLSSNPMDSLVNKFVEPSPDKRTFTEEQAIELYDCLDLPDEELNGRVVGLWVTHSTGVRKGEILGITWRYMYLADLYIRIGKQLTKEGLLESPKNNSYRNVSITEEDAAFLMRWKHIQSIRYFNGGPVPDDFPVCSNCNYCKEYLDANGLHPRGGLRKEKTRPQGDDYYPYYEYFLSRSYFDNWRRRFFVEHGFGEYTSVREWEYTDANGQVHKRKRQVGYKGFTTHELRHTQASILTAEGVPAVELQKRFGHTKLSTTETYIHELTGQQPNAAAVMGRIQEKRRKRAQGSEE